MNSGWTRVQHAPFGDGTARRLTAVEVHQLFIELRPGRLAWKPDRRDDEGRIADGLEANPDLAETLEPHALDDERVGIIVDEDVLGRLRTAIGA